MILHIHTAYITYLKWIMGTIIYTLETGKLFYLSNSITKKSFTFRSSPFEQRLELPLSFEHRLKILLWELPCLLPQLPHSLKISNSALNKYSNSYMHNSNLIYIYIYIRINGFEDNLWVCDWALRICRSWGWSRWFGFHTLLRKWINPNWQWRFRKLGRKITVWSLFVFLWAHGLIGFSNKLMLYFSCLIEAAIDNWEQI